MKTVSYEIKCNKSKSIALWQRKFRIKEVVYVKEMINYDEEQLFQNTKRVRPQRQRLRISLIKKWQ